jgi:hypothetical protein
LWFDANVLTAAFVRLVFVLSTLELKVRALTTYRAQNWRQLFNLIPELIGPLRFAGLGFGLWICVFAFLRCIEPHLSDVLGLGMVSLSFGTLFLSDLGTSGRIQSRGREGGER